MKSRTAPALATSRRHLLSGAVIAGVLAAGLAGAGLGRRPATASAPRAVTHAIPHVVPAGKIKHVVVFYQENHSFDETLGKFCQAHAGRCDGYTGTVRMDDGTVVNMRQSPDIVPGVWHDVHSQDVAINGGAMNGWDHIVGCRAADHYKCLTYYTPGQIPDLAALASKFVVSDRTFSMYDSPSWGGHVYPAAATLDHFTGDNPLAEADVTPGFGWGCDANKLAPWLDPVTHRTSLQPSCIPARPGTLNAAQYPHNGAFRSTSVAWVPTIFDRLEAKHLAWKIYADTGSGWSICPNFAECEYGVQHQNVVTPPKILSDARAGTLPSYSVLIPGAPGGTSQHNDASMVGGDNWIGKVLSALEHGPEWSSTAVFITYDDCGCFYDHVPPGTNPDGTRQGIRVPMVIVSPYAKVAYTDSHAATFASILKFAEESFGLLALSANDQNAYDFASSFDFASPPTGPRVALSAHPVPAASKQYVATHPLDPDDPT